MNTQQQLEQVRRPDVVADMKRHAGRVGQALRIAFGGRSQLSMADIGLACAGQIINGGFTTHGTVEEVCVAVYEAALYGCDEDCLDYDNEMPAVVGWCWERLSRHDLDYQLPYPLASPDRYIVLAALIAEANKEIAK